VAGLQGDGGTHTGAVGACSAGQQDLEVVGLGGVETCLHVQDGGDSVCQLGAVSTPVCVVVVGGGDDAAVGCERDR